MHSAHARIHTRTLCDAPPPPPSPRLPPLLPQAQLSEQTHVMGVLRDLLCGTADPAITEAATAAAAASRGGGGGDVDDLEAYVLGQVAAVADNVDALQARIAETT